MTPVTLQFSEAADADFEGIINFLKLHAGAATATRYLRLFGQLFLRLQAFPESGASRPQLASDVRIGVVRPYVILYRFNPQPTPTIDVLRIVHGRRRIDGRLLRNLH